MLEELAPMPQRQRAESAPEQAHAQEAPALRILYLLIHPALAPETVSYLTSLSLSLSQIGRAHV